MSQKGLWILCAMCLFARLSTEHTMYQTVKTAVYVYGALRKLSPG